jgi:Cdc6-like AAA superfamily ATPase
MDAITKNQKLAKVRHAFAPGGPVARDWGLFVNRPEQMQKCIEALFQRGLHIALYGERGVGKSSLAIRFPKFIDSFKFQDYRVARINCNTADTFSSIWRKVFRELRIEPPDEPMEDPEDVRYHLERVEGETFLIVLDELDRTDNDDAMSLLADTVKSLSDHAVDATLMLVGVADTVVDLVGEHDSIVRSLAQIHMPRMDVRELESVVREGLKIADVDVEQQACTRIALLAEGLPHYAHLLGQAAGLRAVADDREKVEVVDVEAALSDAVEAPHSMRDAYHKATRSPQQRTNFEQVLLACAYAKRDEFGYFRPASVRKPLSIILEREVEIADYTRHLTALAGKPRDFTLQREGEKWNYRLRFRDPQMQPYTKIRALATGRLTEAQRARLEALYAPEESNEPELPF